MFNICSLKYVIKESKFPEYHNDCIKQLKSNLLNLSSCQALFIYNFISNSSINHDQLSNLQLSYDSVRSSYISTRLHRIENYFHTSKSIESEENLSHDFFLFQLGSIVRLLTKATLNNTKTERKKSESFKDYFKVNWSRLITAFKTVILIGVGSIFIIIPTLANKFENGQWILIALCMTQGDTVGGAFTTMKMRLIGTLLGNIIISFFLSFFLYSRINRINVGLYYIFIIRK
jgi:hypothetical protein